MIRPGSTSLVSQGRVAEADIAYSIRGALAEELQRTPGLTLKPNYPPGTFWLVFPEQWLDPKSPWADRRVRLAASYAIDRQAINQAETLGLSRITGSLIPHTLDFYWPAPVPTHDLAKARQLLAEAGYPKGFDAGDYYCDASYANLGEAVINYLKPAGIRAQLRPLERAAFILQNSQKKLRNIIQTASGAFGNAATRLDAFVAAGGTFTYGTYPDLEGLIQEQASEMDGKKREDPPPHPAAHPREGDGRPHLGAGLHQRARAARGGIGPHPDHEPRLLRPLRGREAQGQVSAGSSRDPGSGGRGVLPPAAAPARANPSQKPFRGGGWRRAHHERRGHHAIPSKTKSFGDWGGRTLPWFPFRYTR